MTELTRMPKEGTPAYNQSCSACNSTQAMYSFWDKEKGLTHLTCVRCKNVLYNPAYTAAVKAKKETRTSYRKDLSFNKATWIKLEIAASRISRYHSARIAGQWKQSDIKAMLHYYLDKDWAGELLGDFRETVTEDALSHKTPTIHTQIRITESQHQTLLGICRTDKTSACIVYRKAAHGVIRLVLEQGDWDFCRELGRLFNQI